MVFFIKKIYEGIADEEVHRQFQRFGKGIFKQKALIKAVNKNGKYSIDASYEYANEFVKAMAEKLLDRKTLATGVIVSTRDLNGMVDYERKKQFMGVKKYIINKEMSGEDILSLLEKVPNALFALSFSFDGMELKIKPKAPASAKSGLGGKAEIKPNFCKIKTSDRSIISELIFETSDFKTAEVSHEYHITEIILPQDEKDPVKIRELAKRKGKIVRKVVINGVEKIMEKEFVA